MNRYEELDRKLTSIKNETENTKDMMTLVASEATDRITELESIKQDAEEVEGELQEYLNNMDGLQAAMERADSIRDEAENQHISI